MSAEKEQASGKRSLPKAGYSVLRIYALQQQFELIPDEDREELPEREAPLEVYWDWQVANLEDCSVALAQGEELPPVKFSVAFGIEITGSRARPEKVLSNLVADFQLQPGETTVPLYMFAKLHGTASMLPYVRQNLSELTVMGPQGSPYYLPVLNVRTLMRGFSIQDSTGWSQLQEHPDVEEQIALDRPSKGQH